MSSIISAGDGAEEVFHALRPGRTAVPDRTPGLVRRAPEIRPSFIRPSFIPLPVIPLPVNQQRATG
jgi:hypothetical protein